MLVMSESFGDLAGQFGTYQWAVHSWTRNLLKGCARHELQGVGDPSLLELYQVNENAHLGGGVMGRIVHLQRRLTPREQAKAGDAQDLRGTAEEVRRATTCAVRLNVPLEKVLRWG